MKLRMTFTPVVASNPPDIGISPAPQDTMQKLGNVLGDNGHCDRRSTSGEVIAFGPVAPCSPAGPRSPAGPWAPAGPAGPVRAFFLFLPSLFALRLPCRRLRAATCSAPD